jgi:hypothetical protein
MAITDNYHMDGIWTMIGPRAITAGAGNGEDILPTNRWSECIIENTGTVALQWAYTLADAEGAIGQYIGVGASVPIMNNNPNMVANIHIHCPGAVNGAMQIRFLEHPHLGTSVGVGDPTGPTQDLTGSPLVPGATL